MDGPALTALTAAEIAARVREGASSAVEVAQAHIARIAELDGRLNAFVAHDPRRVLAEANGIDTRPDRFALPLAGVPVVVTDDFDVAGHPTRHGCVALPAKAVRRDDDLVKRLRAAGAVMIGKSRMPPFETWGFSDGTTRNPVDPALDPGGSGAAVAVAARMAALAVATDGGGAIRVPAAACGVVGLKPGPGVVALPGGVQDRWFGLCATGPLARTATDAALLLEVLGEVPAGGGGPGPGRVALSLRIPSRIGRLSDEHRAALVGAAARLRAGPDGATVQLADPPYPRRLATQWIRRWQAGVAEAVAEASPHPYPLDRRTATVRRRGQRVLQRTPPSQKATAAWRARMLAWMDAGGYDMVLCPVTGRPGLPAGSMARRGYATSLLTMAAHLPCVRAWNLAGLPAAAVPVAVAGRPVGVQLVGRPGAEAAILRAAGRLEHRTVPTGDAVLQPRSALG